MSSFQPPVTPFFASKAWNVANHEDLKSELQKAIVQDPEIEDTTSISVDLETKATKVSSIHLIGSVDSQKEKERAEQIVSVNTRNELEIVNELVVK